jgi:hypothetical protein
MDDLDRKVLSAVVKDIVHIKRCRDDIACIMRFINSPANWIPPSEFVKRLKRMVPQCNPVVFNTGVAKPSDNKDNADRCWEAVALKGKKQ